MIEKYFRTRKRKVFLTFLEGITFWQPQRQRKNCVCSTCDHVGQLDRQEYRRRYSVSKISAALIQNNLQLLERRIRCLLGSSRIICGRILQRRVYSKQQRKYQKNKKQSRVRTSDSTLQLNVTRDFQKNFKQGTDSYRDVAYDQLFKIYFFHINVV